MRASSPSVPWDRPPELDHALRSLEVLWSERQNPVYLWRAVELCLVWRNPKGEICGPFQFPNWVLRYLLNVAVTVHRIAIKEVTDTDDASNPRRPLKNKEAGPEILEALGFSSRGRQLFKEWLQEQMDVAVSVIVEGLKVREGTYAAAYEKLADANLFGLRPRRDPAGGETGARSVERIARRGRSRLGSVSPSNAQGTKT
jgi:hypothetical protein